MNEEFIVDGTDSPTYLGHPALVRSLVEGYVDKIYNGIKQRGAGKLSKDDFQEQLSVWSKEFSDIFLGKNPEYTKIVGWNSPFALGIAIKQTLGEFWVKNKEHYENDSGRVLFAWLAASMVDATLKSSDDPDLAGAQIKTKMEQVVKLLLGLVRRR